MPGLSVLLAMEIREGWRTRRTPVVIALFAVLGMAAPLLARLTPEIVAASGGAAMAAAIPSPTAADAVGQFLKLTGQLGAFVAVLIAMGAVAGDRERGTAALVLTKPVSRGAYLAAKLIALAAVLLAASAAAGAAAAAYTAALFTALPVGGTAAAIGLTWVGLLVPASVTFLGSVVGRSPMAAAGVGFAWVVLSGAVSAVPSLGPGTPGALAGAARSLALGAGGIGPATLLAPLLASLAIIAGAALVAGRAFARQEL